MQFSGGRINRYLIANSSENYLLYNRSSESVVNISISNLGNKLIINSTKDVNFYFYSAQFLKVI